MPSVSLSGIFSGNSTAQTVASGKVLPVADATGVTVDTTTYDNPVTGSGKIATIVFPTETTAFAIAIGGDAFPRWCFASDPVNDDLTLGDGTHSPDDGNGAFIGTSPKQTDGSQVLNIGGALGQMTLGFLEANANGGAVNISNAPLRLAPGGIGSPSLSGGSGDPSGGWKGKPGDIFFRGDGGVGSTIYRCTASPSTWVAIL